MLKVKNILFLFILLFTTFSCNNKTVKIDFNEIDNLWKTYQSQFQKGLYQEASKTAKSIALRTENPAFFQENIKAYIHYYKAVEYFEQEPILLAIKDLEVLKESKDDVRKKAVLITLQNRLILKYLNNIGLRNNETLENFTLENLTQWSTENLANYLYNNFLFVIENKNVLLTTNINTTSVLLEESSYFNPNSLYELLLIETALNIEESYIAKQLFSNLESLESKSIFYYEPEKFVQTNVFDGFSKFQQQIIQVFQSLENIALKEENRVKQHIYLIKRLKVSDALIAEDTSLQVHLKSLLFGLTKVNHSIDAEIDYLKASFLVTFSLPTIEETDEKRILDTYIEVLRLCKQAFENHPNSYGASEATVLYKRIVNPNVSLSFSGASLPNTKQSVSIATTNISSFDLYWFKNEMQLNQKDSLYRLIKNKDPLFKTNISVNQKPYRQFSKDTLISTPKEAGKYLLVVFAKNNFDSVINSISVNNSILVVSRIFENPKAETYLIRNFLTGEPIPNAKVNLQEVSYNYNLNDSKKIVRTFLTLTADNQGKFSFERENKLQQLQIEVIHQQDTLKHGLGYFRDYKSSTQNRKVLYLFTDRAVYKPGQTVNFKAVLVNYANNTSNLESNYKLLLSFKNSNFENTTQKDFTTDNQGAFSGSFIIADNELPGNFTIYSNFGQKRVLVEHFKKPVAEIILNTPETRIMSGDNVLFSGSVKRFSGEPIANGKIQFEFSHNQYFGRMGSTDNQKDVGITTTDKNGNFSFSLATEKAHENYQLSLNYSDASGETATVEKSFYLPYMGCNVEIDGSNKFEENQEVRFNISLKNAFEKSLVLPMQYQLFKISKLSNYPARQQPDEKSSKIVYNNLKEIIKSDSAIFSDNSLLSLGKLPVGIYQLVFALDSSKNFKTIDFFVIQNKPSKKILPISFYSYFNQDSSAIILGSNQNELNILMQLATEEKCSNKLLKLSNQQILIPVNKQDLAEGEQIMYSFSAIKNGLNYPIENNYNSTILSYTKPEKKQEVNFIYKGFRDHVSPGDSVSFSIEIENKNKENFNLTASLYDASLDVYQKNTWSAIPKKLNRYVYLPRVEQVNTEVNSNLSAYVSIDYPGFEQAPWPRLNLFNWIDSYNRQIIYRSSRAEVMLSADISNDSAAKVADMENEESDDLNQQNTVRKDFKETVFFYPSIKSNKPNLFNFRFKMPDDLTRWQLNLLTYSDKISSKTAEKTITSKLPLFVQMAKPSFFREGDLVNLPVTVYTNSNFIQPVVLQISISDAFTNQDITADWLNGSPTQTLTPTENGQLAFFSVQPKAGHGAIKVSVTALQGKNSDTEQYSFMVQPEKYLVFESFPFWVEPGGKQTHSFSKLKTQGSNPNYKTDFITLNATWNAFWEVAAVIPYLQGEESKSVLEASSKLFILNSLKETLNKHPRLAADLTFFKNQIRPNGEDPLSKFNELKRQKVTQTPWQRASIADQENFALLASMLSPNELNYAIKNLEYFIEKSQLPNGAWPWLVGSNQSEMVTELTLLALLEIGFENNKNASFFNSFNKALQFVENSQLNTYRRNNDYKPSQFYQWVLQVYKNEQYFSEPYKAFIKQAFEKDIKTIYEKDIYQQAQLLEVLFYAGKRTEGNQLAASLKDRSKTENGKTFWDSPDTKGASLQSSINLLLNLGKSLSLYYPNSALVSGIELSLLNNKRMNFWGNSYTTAKVCNYLLQNADFSSFGSTENQLIWANEYIPLTPKTNQVSVFKTDIKQPEKLAEVVIESAENSPGWGNINWAYQASAAHIEKSNNASLSIKRSFLTKQQVNDSWLLVEPKNNTLLQQDRLYVNWEITLSESQTMMQLTDFLPAGFEPEIGISGNQYQGNVGFYLSVKPSQIDLFFDYLPKGTHIIRVPVIAARKGEYSAGFAEIQNYFAPEFNAISDGLRISIK